jgi:citrate lyase subunit beta/citryl-CoA lyase
MPGSNRAAIKKSLGLDIDAVIIDLEDAIAFQEKQTARSVLVEEIQQGDFGWRQVVVRVNGLDTQWFEDDLAALKGLPLEAILFPKVNSAADIHAAAAAMTAAGMAPAIDLWAMVETSTAVLNAAEIATSTPRLRCLVVGINDLAKDLHVAQTVGRLSLLTSLSLIVLAGRSAGLSLVDGVFTDLENETAFEGACRQGRELGFDGKTLIHPKQIETANRIFSPSKQEIKKARRLIETFEAAQAEGKGVAVLDGRMIERLHAEEAQRLLEKASRITNR